MLNFPLPSEALEEVILRLDGITPSRELYRSEEDPITGRVIGRKCWNGQHYDPDVIKQFFCDGTGCYCMCHDDSRGGPPA